MVAIKLDKVTKIVEDLMIATVVVTREAVGAFNHTSGQPTLTVTQIYTGKGMVLPPDRSTDADDFYWGYIPKEATAAKGDFLVVTKADDPQLLTLEFEVVGPTSTTYPAFRILNLSIRKLPGEP